MIMNTKLYQSLKEEYRNFSLKRFCFLILISFFLLFFFYALKDFNKYYLKKEPICRIDNVININNGKICYGFSDNLQRNNWMGNHIWEIKENKRIDNTCKDCDIEVTKGCLYIKNNDIVMSYSSLSNFFISLYYKNLFFIKSMYEI